MRKRALTFVLAAITLAGCGEWFDTCIMGRPAPLTGVWTGFVQVSGDTGDAIADLVMSPDGELSGTLETVPTDGYRHRITGKVSRHSIGAEIHVRNDLCEGVFRVNGGIRDGVMELSGDGAPCWPEEGVSFRAKFGRMTANAATGSGPTRLHRWSGPLIEHPRLEQPVEQFPNRWDGSPIVEAQIDNATGNPASFSFRIPPINTAADTNDSSRWPTGTPAYLDWIVLDLDHLAATGPYGERLFTRRDGWLFRGDGHWSLHRLISHPNEPIMELDAEVFDPGENELLAGLTLSGRWYPGHVQADFRPRPFSYRIHLSRTPVAASGSVELKGFDPGKRQSGSVDLKAHSRAFDTSIRPHQLLALRLRTDGAFSSVGLLPLTRGDLRVDYPRVTVRELADGTGLKMTVRTDLALIVNERQIIAPLFPAEGIGTVQIIGGTCAGADPEAPDTVRNQCPGTLIHLLPFTLTVPPPVIAAQFPHPPREGSVILPPPDGRYSDEDWLSIHLSFEGLTDERAEQWLLLPLKDTRPGPLNMERFVVTPTQMNLKAGELASFTFDGILNTGDRMPLLHDPDTRISVSEISHPMPGISVSPGTVRAARPGEGSVHIRNRKFPLWPVSITILVE